MLTEKLFHFISGWIVFTAEGGFTERFINLCRRFGVSIWGLEGTENGLRARTDIRGYKMLHIPALRSGMKIRREGEHGLPFTLRAYRRRFGLLAGAAFFVAVTVILSGRIWLISVEGNHAVPEEKIIGVLDELGFRRGVRADKIENSVLKFGAMSRLPEISWLSVNVFGSKAVVVVREATVTPIESTGAVCDLVADRPGQLLRLVVYNGTGNIQPGSAVLPGDVLISGFEENRDGSADLCGAEGEAIALTRRRVSAGVEENEIFPQRRLSCEKRSLYFLCRPLRLGGAPAPGAFDELLSLELNGAELPFGLLYSREYTVTDDRTGVNGSLLKHIALGRFFDAALGELTVEEFKSAELAVTDTGGVTIEGNFTCVESIGILREAVPEDAAQHNPS